MATAFFEGEDDTTVVMLGSILYAEYIRCLNENERRRIKELVHHRCAKDLDITTRPDFRDVLTTDAAQ